MKKMFLILLLLLLPLNGYSYDTLFDATTPSDMGTVALIHDGAGIVSTSTRWKSSMLQATSTGNATHFIIHVGSSNVGTQPVGFAVYANTGTAQTNPPGALLIRGYIASYNFNTNGAGYYAFPFLSDATLAVTAGTWYHVVALLTPQTESPGSGWRLSDPMAYYEPAGGSSYPWKWASDCSASECDANMPPGVGTEITFAEENNPYIPASAGWSYGLLITGNSPSSVQGLTIKGGTLK